MTQEEKDQYIGRKVQLYIPEEKRHMKTTVKNVRELESGKKIAYLKSGAVLSLDILKFDKEGEEENNGKTKEES